MTDGLFVTMCDAIVDELTMNIPELADVSVHRYAPWDPEELQADGKRHLGVWPMADRNDNPTVLVGDGHELSQFYSVLYWEPDVAAVRGTKDEAGAKALLSLQDAVRGRLYVSVNQNLGEAERVWYAGTSLPERSMQVRWFRLVVEVRQIAHFT